MDAVFGTESWIQLRFVTCRDFADWYRFEPEIKRFIKLIKLLPPEHRSSHSLRRAFIRASYAKRSETEEGGNEGGLR
jgi:hypothetical protein